MLLAKDNPEPNFIGYVASASEEELRVHLVAYAGGMEEASGGASCEAGFAYVDPGWPTVHKYHLAENDPNGLQKAR